MTQQRLILTLMGPRLSERVLNEVDGLLQRHGLRTQIHRDLASPVPADEALPAQGVCREYVVEGERVDLEVLRRESLTLAAAHEVDIAVREAGHDPWRYRLVCFDMDSTLIKAEVIDELARRHGVYDQVSAVTERAMRGELDFQQSFRERMAKLRGLDESVLIEIADTLPLMEGGERLMRNLKRLGYRTAIVSGGFTYFARYLQSRLGFDEVHANELVLDSGQVTGSVREPIVDADRKAYWLRTIAEREGWALEQTVAVGDGANDLKMLASAGLGVAFHAKPLVREQASYSIATLGLDALLYLLGHADDELTP
ncbi:phosphoserine phosphatase SerB [Aidingimonas lacisalsi]|uniref:phosphoserine phosphatase SerB n=1 Tax=Aidingimonas lacisalsi TaxID=2604086 RepID=UPI001F004F05|nr:phosphoserine phosphatase SerB [Aidingimonas lacisalsi]